MAGRGDVVIRIRADYTDKDLNRAQRDIDSLRRNAQQTAPAMAGLGRGFAAAGAALAGMVGIQEITQFLKDSAQAAMQDEKSMKALAKAMDNVGLASQMPEIETGIGRMSRMLGIADDQLRPAFQQLALATEDVAESQKLLSVALDISAGTGRDLESVTLALAKASSGQTTALQRLGVGLDASILKSRDMDAITAELTRKFGGQAATAAETYSGKMARITVAVDEAKEAIGRGLLDGLDRMSESMGGVDGAISFIDEMGIALGDAARGAGIAGAAAIDFRNDLYSSIPGLDRFKLSLVDTLLLGVNPLILGLAKLGGSAEIPGMGVPSKGTGGLKPIRPSNYIPGLMDPVGDTGTSGSVAGTTYGMARTGSAGGSVDRVIGAEMQRRLDLAARILQNQAQPALANASIQVAQAMFAKFADQRGPAADQVRGLFDQAFSVLGEKIEAARQIGQQVADGLTGQLSLASALEKAKETGGSIVDAFIDQGAKIQAFAGNLQKLLNAGLSKQAFDEIVSAGYQRGADIADALLTGNVNENVRRANEVYTSVNNIAVQTGNQAAAAFGQVGIQMAIDMMQALIDALTGKKGKAYRTLQEAMDSLAASLYRKTFIDIETRNIGGGGAASFTPTPSGVMEQQQAIALQAFNAGTGIFDPGALLDFFPVMGDGGPVTANRPYIVGDMGPELFVPNTSGTIIPNGGLGGGLGGGSAFGGSTYNITVQAGVGDPREIGRQVVEAIKSFERASGPVFASA